MILRYAIINITSVFVCSWKNKRKFAYLQAVDLLEIAFTIVLLILVLLFYFSNRDNNVNKWCSIAGFIFWLGVAKEAVLFNIIPYLQTALHIDNLERYFMPVYSVCTWALYSLAMPTAVIYSLYFCNMSESRPEFMHKTKWLIYTPALLLSFYFTPLAFRAFQLSSLLFWIVYTVYNFIFVVLYAFFIINGVRIETDSKAKIQKKMVRLISLPPVLYWYFTVFPIHTLRITHLFKLWWGNAVLLLISVIAFIIMAFKYGIMGLKLSGETYHWNSDMNLINKGAEYTSHMLKNQTSKMEWCIENLKAQFEQTDNKNPEELAILSRSIDTLRDYTDKIKRQSENIHLMEESFKLKELLEEALPVSLKESKNNIQLQIDVPDGVFWICDKNHMTEAFLNIIMNAFEAVVERGRIEIFGEFDKSGMSYQLCFRDDGAGMDEEELKNMFKPYFTTKSTEKNFGLGLAYCKNVIEKHGGSITAKSEPGKGTTITIQLPSKKVAMSGSGRSDQDV